MKTSALIRSCLVVLCPLVADHESDSHVEAFYFDICTHTVPPGPPTPWIVDTGKDFVIVAWKPPLYNGGGDILGYHVEKVEEVKPATDVSGSPDLCG